jgi:hypothetical protein
MMLYQYISGLSYPLVFFLSQKNVPITPKKISLIDGLIELLADIW